MQIAACIQVHSVNSLPALGTKECRALREGLAGRLVPAGCASTSQPRLLGASLAFPAGW